MTTSVGLDVTTMLEGCDDVDNDGATPVGSPAADDGSGCCNDTGVVFALTDEDAGTDERGTWLTLFVNGKPLLDKLVGMWSMEFSNADMLNAEKKRYKIEIKTMNRDKGIWYKW